MPSSQSDTFIFCLKGMNALISTVWEEFIVAYNGKIAIAWYLCVSDFERTTLDLFWHYIKSVQCLRKLNGIYNKILFLLFMWWIFDTSSQLFWPWVTVIRAIIDCAVAKKTDFSIASKFFAQHWIIGDIYLSYR